MQKGWCYMRGNMLQKGGVLYEGYYAEGVVLYEGYYAKRGVI